MPGPVATTPPGPVVALVPEKTTDDEAPAVAGASAFPVVVAVRHLGDVPRTSMASSRSAAGLGHRLPSDQYVTDPLSDRRLYDDPHRPLPQPQGPGSCRPRPEPALKGWRSCGANPLAPHRHLSRPLSGTGGPCPSSFGGSSEQQRAARPAAGAGASAADAGPAPGVREKGCPGRDRRHGLGSGPRRDGPPPGRRLVTAGACLRGAERAVCVLRGGSIAAHDG